MEEEKAILKNAQKEAMKIITDAKSAAQKSLKEAEESTIKRTEKMIAEAKLEIEDQASQTEKRLMQHVSEVSVDFLKKSVI